MIAVAGTLLLTAVLRRRLLLVTVQGNSMSPTLRAGDRVVALRIGRRVRRGWIVIVALDATRRQTWAAAPSLR